MNTLTATEWAILDTTAHESTDLEQLYQRLHRPPISLPLADAAEAVQALLLKGLLTTDGPRSVLSARFAITQDGRDLWTSTVEARPRRSLFGIWKDRGIHLTQDDIDEMRGEMWKGFPRDEPK